MESELGCVALGCRAMNTQFEVALWGGDESHLRAAGEEALREIQRLEAQLSFFRSDSDVSELNAFAAERPVTVEPRLFRLLERAAELSVMTGGAFDITIAPLLRAWGFVGASGRMPMESEVQAAREITGMNLVELDPVELTVRFRKPGVMIDLGAIGKGYAIEQAAEVLQECGVGGALIHGGTSTVHAIGAQADGSPCQIAIQDPINPKNHLAVVPLRDMSLSVSAVHGKSFTEDDVRYGHVLDPRTGRPVQGALLAVVICESATDSDALSTALLVEGESFLPALTEVRPSLGALVAQRDSSGDLRSASVNLDGIP